MGPGSPDWPPSLKTGHPPPRCPGESGMDSPVFVGAGAPRLLGAGRWVWLDKRGVVHLDKPLRLGVVNGSWVWQRELPGPGKRWGEVGDPPEIVVKMFELAQTNTFITERKKGGGAPTSGSSPTAGRGWAWGGLSWWGRLGSGRRPGRHCWTSGFSTPRRRTGGCMPGWNMASPPSPSPSPSPPPTPLGAPCSRTPPTPRTPSPRH